MKKDIKKEESEEESSEELATSNPIDEENEAEVDADDKTKKK
jgi:hypothetical protein